MKQSGVEEQTASRDLRGLVSAGLLEAHGQTRGRCYTASGALRDLGEEIRADRLALVDPYPWLVGELRRRAVS